MNMCFYKGRFGRFISELKTMEQVINRTFSIVDDEVASSDKRFRDQKKDIPDEFLDADRHDLWISSDLVPRHIVNSLFTSLFSLFEDEVVKICELIEPRTTSTKTFSNYKNGIGISKCKNYLTYILSININSYPLWQNISDIKDLRNMIAHNNGRFEARDKKLAKRLKKHIDASEYLSRDKLSQIIIEREYLYHVAKVFREFMKNFLAELEVRNLL